MKFYYYLFTFFIYLFSWNTLSNVTEIVNFAAGEIDEINSPFKYTCGVETKEQIDCPYMVNQFRRDTKSGFFFQMISDSPWNSCNKYLTKPEVLSASELESSLASEKQRELGLLNNYFSNQINKCFSSKGKSNEEAHIQKNAIISMSYNYLNKIKKDTHGLSKEIAHINSILGKNPLEGLPCDRFNMPHDKAYCLALEKEKCSPTNELDTLNDDLFESAVEPIYALSKKIKEIRRTYRGRAKSRQKVKEIKKIKSLIEFIKAENPILMGNHLNEFIDKSIVASAELPSKESFKRELKTQFTENKKILSSKLKRNISMNHCILYGDSGECDEFEEKLREIPYMQTSMIFNKDGLKTEEGRQKQRAREEIYQVPECMDRTRNLKNDFNSFATNMSINVGLTVFTGGAGLLLRAGQLGKLALAARATTLGADAAYLGAGVNDAIKECDKELNGMEEISKSTNQNICPVKLEDPRYLKTKNVRGCVTAALLTSVDALPFVPAIASRFSKANRTPSANRNVELEKTEFDKLSKDLKSSGCGKYKTNTKKCKDFVANNRERLEIMHQQCLKKSASINAVGPCKQLDEFMNMNQVLRLSDMIPVDKRGKSVVVEFNSGRGHLTLRYFKEVVDENGEKVMKAFSYDGTSWLLPRRVNESMFTRSKNVDDLPSLDTYVPGSHYLIDISPSQVEKIHDVAKRGGFSKACTHDARIALDEAGILSMPKGIGGTFDKITIKQLAKDLTDKYGKPSQSTIKGMQDVLDPKKAGFTDEQWKTFTVTEVGWAVLTPITVAGTYPAGVLASGTIVLTIVDRDGKMIQITKEKYQQLLDELKSL